MQASNELNDAPILDQTREHWQKMLALVLFKVRKQYGAFQIKITVEDIEAMNAAYGGNAVVFTHGHHDSIELSLVTQDQAQMIAAHNAGIKGRA